MLELIWKIDKNLRILRFQYEESQWQRLQRIFCEMKKGFERIQNKEKETYSENRSTVVKEIEKLI